MVWLNWQDYAGKNGMEIRPLKTNLIDEVWTERPERSKAPLHVHELQFAGKLLIFDRLVIFIVEY